MFNMTTAKVDCQTSKINSLPNFLAIIKKIMVRDTAMMTIVLRVLSFRSVGPVLYRDCRNGYTGRTTRGKKRCRLHK